MTSPLTRHELTDIIAGVRIRGDSSARKPAPLKDPQASNGRLKLIAGCLR